MKYLIIFLISVNSYAQGGGSGASAGASGADIYLKKIREEEKNKKLDNEGENKQWQQNT